MMASVALAAPLRVLREASQDARHAMRLWAKHPWQTGFAIFALAIGIGANTGVFSVVNALLLRSLPFRDARRLVSIQTYLVPHDSAKEFHDWRQRSRYLSDAAIFEQFDFNIGSTQQVMRAHVAQTSWNFFRLLGAKPVLGRGFETGEDTRGHNAVAVIGYGLWQQLFAGEQRVLGASIRLNGAPLTIIGVAPEGFEFPGHTVLWKAAEFSPGNNGWETVGRLRPGIGWGPARAAFAAEMDGLLPALKLRNPEHPRITSLQDELAGPVKNASLMLMAGVGFILLIACTNVANLLLARNMDRAAELATRAALGASRGRLTRQLLTECLLLAFLAAAAGLVAALWTTSLAEKVQPAPLATQSYSILDVRVLGFAAAVAMLSGLLFGILPALDAGRLDGNSKSHGSSGTRGSRLMRETLLAAQVMLTVVLLTGSVSIGRAFVDLMRIDRGFDVRGLVTVSVSLDGTTHDRPGQSLAYFEEVLARIRRLAGVRSASATEFLPLYATDFVGGPFGIDGRPAEQSSMLVPLLPDYFRTMGGRILYGREFTDKEVRSDAKVAIINELFAREFGAPPDALGHNVTLGDEPARRIIGVVRGMNYRFGQTWANSTQIFIPAHSPGSFYSTFVVRVNGAAEDRVAMIRDTIRSVDMQVPVFGAKTMKTRLDDALSRPKFYGTALRCFAAFGLLLVVIGIYGAVSCAISRRTRELCVRLALGSTPGRLRRILLGQTLGTVAAGALFGMAGAPLTGRFLESMVEGAKPADFAMLCLSILFILAIAATSVWAATRRIAKLDVMEMLRIV